MLTKIMKKIIHKHLGPCRVGTCAFRGGDVPNLSPFWEETARVLQGLSWKCLRVLAGSTGIGAVYGYDAVGSFERTRVACAGGGLNLMQPVLDRLDADKGEKGGDTGECPVVTVGLEEALSLVKRAFVAGGERDISLGDAVEIVILTREGQRRERLHLKSH